MEKGDKNEDRIKGERKLSVQGLKALKGPVLDAKGNGFYWNVSMT